MIIDNFNSRMKVLHKDKKNTASMKEVTFLVEVKIWHSRKRNIKKKLRKFNRLRQEENKKVILN